MKKYIFWLILFAAIEIGLSLYLTIWREHFWNAIAQKQSMEFLYQLGIFTIVAVTACFVSGYSGYLVSITAIKWREKLTAKAKEVHMDMMMLIDAGSMHELPENFNQRQQEDCYQYPDLMLNLAYGTIKAVFYILVFSASILIDFEVWFLLVLIGYTVIGSVVTHFIAKPLIHLNYEQQRAEATYRNNLSINNFGDCVRIMLGLAKKQKHLTYWQQFYGQVGVIVPLIIVAPLYFTSGMTIGMLMRFNSVTTTVLDNMSYGINNFAAINRLISCRRRLKECKII